MSDRGPRLRLICINDVYSLEHLPRLATLIARERSEHPADLLLVTLAGDFLAPSMLSSLDAGRGMVDCLNALGVTHVTFGNHEDDVALTELRRRTTELTAVWLATNVPGFEPPLPASDVVTVAAPGGRAISVGLVGVVMNDPSIYRAPPFGVPEVTDPRQALLEESERLFARGCAIVVPLTHQDMSDDRALARSLPPERFPLLVGGHEHTAILEDIAGTWVVKAGSEAEHAVVVELSWPSEAPASSPDVPVVEVRLLDVAAFPEDPALRARVDGHMLAVHALEHATLMTLPPGMPLSSVGTRSRQTTLGALLCSLLRDVMGAEAAILNGGAIRGARDYQGRFTFADLEAEVPFPNEVTVARLPGAVLAEAIVASRARAPAESGGFLQTDDGITLESGVVTRVNGARFDPARVYRVALVRDFFAGLDHEEPLIRQGREHPECVPPVAGGRELKQVLVNAFALALWQRLGSLDDMDTDLDGNISVAELSAAVSRATSEPASEVTVRLLLDAAGADRTRGATRALLDRIVTTRK